MKCPKCGYNSFEFHNVCKKCAHDLTSYKDIHGLKPIVLPHEVRVTMAEQLMAGRREEIHAGAADVPVDMFSFDIPDAEPMAEPSAFLKDDPFSFDDEPLAPAPAGGDFSFDKNQMSAQAKSEEDAFADLLESTSHSKDGGVVSGNNAVATELSDFNWDDTPDPTTGETAKPAKDDFNSLFGETGESAKK